MESEAKLAPVSFRTQMLGKIRHYYADIEQASRNMVSEWSVQKVRLKQEEDSDCYYLLSLSLSVCVCVCVCVSLCVCEWMNVIFQSY